MASSESYELEMPAYQAEPTAQKFHADPAFFRGIRGPLGSGKSVACCAEVMGKALTARPYKGVRRSKWAIIRNTYGELRTTTIKTWLDWFGPVTRINYGHPIIATIVLPPLPDGTRVECQIVFLALDRDADVRKLKSLELTGVWLNEASEIGFSVLEMATGRVNRYPGMMLGGFDWSGIIADTNSCDVSNWWYRLAEEERPENYSFYSQPPALLTVKGPDGIQYVPNPAAENIDNHVTGFNYYLLQLFGKPKEWVKVFILNQYGSADASNVVYGDYDERNHCAVEADKNLGHLIWTHDFNFTPLSSIVMQRDSSNNVYCVDEIVLGSAVAKQTAAEFCERYKDYKGCLVKVYGDASGHAGEKHGHASDFITIERILRSEGFRVEMKVPRSNPSIKDGQESLRARICDATEHRAFFVNPRRCPTLDKGLQALKLKQGSTFQEEDADYQHITTAARYFTAVEFPIQHRVALGFGLQG
ncbi:hypothetical protein SAMN04488503_2238 [Humidesulfovibrio mexicanus]|uniref:Phage terminase large subunit n=1 Tax=Humidesulfovibrio mexicanus TaxID=147047 RepID=A0A239AWK7_9BACT|nr:hypothetical protein [Humidesulfovibrio mexicanus]SNR99424.1 hypothetical protein SAMN04488503_2238 [Humidesulfovibrio mexicanus]